MHTIQENIKQKRLLVSMKIVHLLNITIDLKLI